MMSGARKVLFGGVFSLLCCSYLWAAEEGKTTAVAATNNVSTQAVVAVSNAPQYGFVEAKFEDNGENDLFRRAPWSASLGLGFVTFEGDEKVEDGLFIPLRLGYDMSPRWTVEGALEVYPSLRNRSFDSPNRHGLDSSIWAMRLGMNVLYHLRNVKNLHWDPFLSVGGGGIYYSKKIQDYGYVQPNVMGGCGLFYHFNDAWALRADAQVALVFGTHNEFNGLFTLGVNYRWGTQAKPNYEVVGGGIDSDADGLTDAEEEQIGTDPYDPDTDKDGLTDGEEVKVYHTDPLNPDSDWDGLTDGAEVLTYKTNPLDRDTDKGGVSDGHEVIEDHTNPLDPKDDLMLFTLNIEYDYDKATIKTQYYDKLDAVVKVLRRDPLAKAKVEGHCDKWPKSERVYNQKLSERRANGVLDYLSNVGGVERTRLQARGYGFDRPIASNDVPENRAHNRRTEIYITPGATVAAQALSNGVSQVSSKEATWPLGVDATNRPPAMPKK